MNYRIFLLTLLSCAVFQSIAQLPMFDADLKRAPHLQTKGELADSMGVMGVTDIFTRVQGEVVIEYFETNTGRFLGFAGDTSKFDWCKMKLFRRVPVMRRLVKKYGPIQTLNIFRGELVKGLSERDVFEIKGKPKKIGREDKRKVWTYGDTTLYFLKGELVEIQVDSDSRT